MRVLNVLTRAYRRGAETFGMELHGQLLTRGLDSDVVALAAAPDGHTALDVPVLGRRTRGLDTLRRLRRAAGAPDVVVAHGSDTLLACRLALMGTRTPFVYVNIGDPLHWAGSPSRRVRVAWMLRGATVVGAISPTAVERLVSHLGVPPERARFTGNGRRASHFVPATGQERQSARERIGLPSDAPIAVVLAALSREKRLDVAISAVGRLPAWHLLVLGEGPLHRELERQAEACAPGRVHLIGSVDDVRPGLHAADVALLTSTTEGLPGSLIESAMSGLPAVATDVGFVRDLVRDGATGRLVPVGDIAATAEALEDCHTHAASWGSASREEVAALFDTDLVVDRWTALLHDAVTARHVQ
jgi:glycosyltransferase involved in cell wall biosynthesis